MKELLSNCKVQRGLMLLAAIGIALLACIPSLRDSQAVLFPLASGLFGWALKAPGHEGQ